MSGSSVQNGYILPKCQYIYLNQKDSQKYGIKETDWAKVDKNQDGYIDINELITNGVNVSSVNNAYKQLAITNNGWINEADSTKYLSQTNQNATQNNFKKPYNLNHPNVTSPLLANNCDFLA